VWQYRVALLWPEPPSSLAASADAGLISCIWPDHQRRRALAIKADVPQLNLEESRQGVYRITLVDRRTLALVEFQLEGAICIALIHYHESYRNVAPRSVQVVCA
jgi:hypothetical protein